ncbi:MAG: type II toxin-antitoxin system VapC family toxin [Alphaproteobacteria bacterium]|mgnify:FL=1|nr:type II toxin-antitoxin system VapC family toxin [Alphaproteobacteria bacterium]
MALTGSAGEPKGYLLDTAVLVWFVNADPRLSPAVADLIQHTDAPVYVSAASVFELSYKYSKGILPEVEPLVERFKQVKFVYQFKELDISSPAARLAATFERDSDISDPLRNMIAAQAMTDGLVLITTDDCEDLLGLEYLMAGPA